MGGNIVFEIHDSREVRARLIEAVPDGWAWVSGYLEAPARFVSAGIAHSTTGFILRRPHLNEPTVVGRRLNGGGRAIADIFAVLAGGQLPGFVEFNRAGFGDPAVTLEVANRFAALYVRKGYCGELHFASGFRDDNMMSNPERCFIFLSKGWQYAPFAAEGNPPAVWLSWVESHGGKEENIRAIADACRLIGLKQIELARSS